MTNQSDNSSRRVSRGWLVVAAFVVVGAGLGMVRIIQSAKEQRVAAAAVPAGRAPSAVLVVSVDEVSLRETQQVIGSLRAVSRAEVAAREAGAVEEILVDEGDTVAEGAVLVRLDGRRLEAEIGRARGLIGVAKAGIEESEATLKRTRQDLEVKQSLLERRAVSQREALDAGQANAVAEAKLNSAKQTIAEVNSQLELLEVRRHDLAITAPFAGRIASRLVERGEWVQPGQSVVELLSTGAIEAWLQVPERHMDTLVTDKISLTISSTGDVIESTRIRAVPDVDLKSRLFPLIATIDDEGGRLTPGMSVRAELPLGEAAPRLVVPGDVVVTSRLGSAVFRVGEVGEAGLPVAERVPVEVLFEKEGMAYLGSAGDLKKGDQVVKEGNERLMAGASLLVSAADQPN